MNLCRTLNPTVVEHAFFSGVLEILWKLLYSESLINYHQVKINAIHTVSLDQNSDDDQ
jgi:hypothetical protein